ncbi:MAG TPA: hypothetical protein DD827_03825 [Gammaproteobacteria bacterium]|nr:hypothetical protein [Gammaproteobacteria bacterium]
MIYRENNSIRLLSSGQESYEVRWKILSNARSSIHLATFSFMKDKTTRKLFDLLKEKKKSGVDVRIIYDEIVNRTTFVGGWIRELQKEGIEVYGYNSIKDGWFLDFNKKHPFRWLKKIAKRKLKQHFHEKYLIVDNQHLIIGGNNWGDKYAFGGIEPKAWRDTDVYITGETVRDVQLQFLRDCEMQKEWSIQKKKRMYYSDFSQAYLSTYQNDEGVISKYSELFSNIPPVLNLDRKSNISFMAHKPYEENELKLTNYFLNEIINSNSRIYWGCHGIRPPKIFTEHLIAAANRGVKVVLITNSKMSSKTLMAGGLLGWMYKECSKHFKALLENGVEIHEWQKPGAFHSKSLVVDEDMVSIGSYNIASGSAFNHSESNVIVKNKEFCNEVFQQFKVDLKSCVKLDIGKYNFPKENAFERKIQERNDMLSDEVLTESIRHGIQKRNFEESSKDDFFDVWMEY